MTNFLKRIWRKMFGVKTGSFDTEATIGKDKLPDGFSYIYPNIIKIPGGYAGRISIRPAYDPSTDERKILMGEVESYFD